MNHPGKGKKIPGQIPLFEAPPTIAQEPQVPRIELVEMANQLKGTNQMGPLEKKIFNRLLQALSTSEPRKEGFVFSLTDILSGTPWITPQGMLVEEAEKAVLAALEGLQKHIARFKFPQRRHYLQCSLIGEVELDIPANKLQIWVGERAVPLLKKFYESFQEDAAGMMHFNSFYSQFFYKFFQENKNQQTFYFPILELRATLGIKPHEYERYNDFKRCVLLVAQEELARHGYVFDFREERGGKDKRKYVGIHFKVKNRLLLTVE